MTTYVERAGLSVATELADLVEKEVLVTGISAGQFWAGYAALLADLAPENAALLARRDSLQGQIDTWHKEHGLGDGATYRAFLGEIGYLVAEPAPFNVETENVDPEIAKTSGPQLVVPLMNARFALNAANARWGSLYDALYGSDAIAGEIKTDGYDAARGAAVIAWARAHLDRVVPLKEGSWANATGLGVTGSALRIEMGQGSTSLAMPEQFAGFRAGSSVFLRVNGLLIEIVIDGTSEIGSADPAQIADIRLEAALTAIQDCEDSVAAVDAADKVQVYRNWLGLMTGELCERFEKDGETIERHLSPDVSFLAPDGSAVQHPGRALLLVRNVGHLMTTDAVLMNGQETPEGILDAMVTVAAAMHDLRKTDGPRNSREGSVYVVKPKMHGPEEVAFANRLFGRVEEVLGLTANTVKLGIMDEERRTSANLTACIKAVKQRCVFINTGFLDRTGDEIHTSMLAGPVIPRDEMASALWLSTYEAGNVDAGLAAGLMGRGQIGKGMWAKPDNLGEMLSVKKAHLEAGANTAWVPSPTASLLHVTHYHQVDVAEVQKRLMTLDKTERDDLLTPPVMNGRNLSSEQVTYELENACQSILGYVVRWVDQGIGCSKVPNIEDVALMEDRATLRISAQYLANWLLHGITTKEDVLAAFARMAVKVDAQNADDPAYQPMAPGLDGIAYKAACDLVLKGATQPSGYTEPLLHAARRAVKAIA